MNDTVVDPIPAFNIFESVKRNPASNLGSYTGLWLCCFIGQISYLILTFYYLKMA